jgi:methyl-accepting chemotaxis protein
MNVPIFLPPRFQPAHHVLAIAVRLPDMHPPMSDLGIGAPPGYYSRLLAGYVAYRLGWLERTPSLRFALLGGYLLASLLTIINVWFAAAQMFASQHDLQLGAILLVFATGIAMLLGYFVSSAITRRIQSLQQAAQQLANGDLTTRAPVEGRDEVAAWRPASTTTERLQEADASSASSTGCVATWSPGQATTCKPR